MRRTPIGGIPGLGRAAALGALSVLSGCFAFVPPPDGPYSFGTTNDGGIRHGVALPDRGEGFVRARPGEETRYGTPTLIAALERTAAEVARRFPGSAPLRIGDLASPGGGRHPRHGSHRSGRDADVLFYMTDPSGRSREGRGWLAYNRFGYAVEHERPDGGPAGALFLFDTERNWHFVRTLLLDEEAGVQWLFVSRGVKARLLRYGIDHETDPRVLARAAFVLHQPANAAPHDDHFHVRVLCTPRELAHDCRQRGPIWPWLRAEREKPEVVRGDTLDDDALVRELLTPPLELDDAPAESPP